MLWREGREWRLRIAGEPDAAVDLEAHDPDRRARTLSHDGVERALVCLSHPLGIEALAPEEAEPLLAAHNAGVLDLGGPFGAWGAVGLDPLRPASVDELLDRGAVGVSLPATALETPAAVAGLAALLDRLDARSAPLFVHPGAAPRGRPEAERAARRGSPAHRGAGAEHAPPPWWPALTRYVAEMNAAWHAFLAAGRPRHPRLRVMFAALAGAAPLHLERLAARGGSVELALDPNTFYDTSSYGAQAVDSMARIVGLGQLVYGSDRPVIEPARGPTANLAGPSGSRADDNAFRTTNPTRLLRGSP
jgi:hypothetical protein